MARLYCRCRRGRGRGRWRGGARRRKLIGGAVSRNTTQATPTKPASPRLAPPRPRARECAAPTCPSSSAHPVRGLFKSARPAFVTISPVAPPHPPNPSTRQNHHHHPQTNNTTQENERARVNITVNRRGFRRVGLPTVGGYIVEHGYTLRASYSRRRPSKTVPSRVRSVPMRTSRVRKSRA